MARTLADILTPEEKTRFDELYRSGGITPTTAQAFADRFASEVDDIDYRLRENERVRQMPYSPSLARSPEALARHLDEQREQLRIRRQQAFDTALDTSFGQRSLSQLMNLERAVISGYADERFRETLEERGPLGVGEDLARSLLTSVPRGIEATAETLGGGFGDRPIERIGEMTGFLMPLRAGAGLASTIARGAGRPRLADMLSRTVTHPVSRAAGWTGEAADILGAEEDVYYEGLLEILGEGVAEGGAAIGSRALPTPETPETPPDPIAQKQADRKAANDAAAERTAQRARGPQMQAALDAHAIQLTAITQNIATGKGQATPEDIAQMSDEQFADVFDRHVTPNISDLITGLEEQGIENPAEKLRELTLALHQSLRGEVEADQGATDEQVGEDATEARRSTDPRGVDETAGDVQRSEPPERDEGTDSGPPTGEDDRSGKETDTEQPVYEPYEPPDLPEMTPEEEAEYFKVLVDNNIESMSEWMLEYEPDVDNVETVVSNLLEEAYQMGDLAPEDIQQIRDPVIEGVKERLPDMIDAEQEYTQRAEEIDTYLENNIENIKYKKSSQTFKLDTGDEKDFDGYIVENTGIDYAEIFITRIGNNWVALDPRTAVHVAGGYRDNNGPYSKREDAVRAAMQNILHTGEEDYRTDILGETPPEATPDEPEQETQPADETPETREAVDDTPPDTLPEPAKAFGEDDEPEIPAPAPTPTIEQPPEPRDWAGLDYEIANEILNEVEQTPNNDPRALLNIKFDELVRNGTLSEQDAQNLRLEVEKIVDGGIVDVLTPAETTDRRVPTSEPPTPTESPEESGEPTQEAQPPEPETPTQIPESVLDELVEYFVQTQRELSDYTDKNFHQEYEPVRILLNAGLVPPGNVAATRAAAEILPPVMDTIREKAAALEESIADKERQSIPPEPQPPELPPSSDTVLADMMEITGFAEDATPEDKLEFVLRAYLRTSQDDLTAPQLFAGAQAAFGNQYNSQTVYDVLEVAVNKHIERRDLWKVDVGVEGAIANIQAIQEIERRLPRQADRTAAKEANQQFSTPFHYAYLVNWVANLTDDDIVLEPSAGTGNLAWASKTAGADVHVNEISDHRYQLLDKNFFNATQVDARQIDKRLPNVKPTVVVMNPPFSSTQGQKKNLLLGVNMVESALKTLQPGGRLVAIVNGGRDLTPEMIAGETVGGGPNFDVTTYRKFWNRIAKDYQIRANLHVNGQIYKDMGTDFNTRLFVIDKPVPGENTNPLRTVDGIKPEFDVMQKQRIDTITEGVTLLEDVRNARTSEDEQQPSEPARQTPIDETRRGRSVPPTEPEPRTPVSRTPSEPPADDVSADPDGVDTRGAPAGGDIRREPADVAGESVGTETRTPDGSVEVAELGEGTRTIPTGAGPGTGGRDSGQDAGERGGLRTREDRSELERGTAAESGRRSDRLDTGDRVAEAPDASKVWVPASDSHIVKGRRVNLQETVSLATINSPDVSNIEIDIPADFLQRYSQAQQKAIRLALRAHESFIEPEIVGDERPRQGFYDGDDTGVGKTWIAAGLFIHNQRQGRKKNIFVTATQDLIKDFQEAYPLAGGDAEATFNITDGLKNEGILISTYSTLGGRNMDPTRISEILEWATGEKPPQSILNPRTDTELMMFGELPRTLELAWNMYQAGDALPSRVTELMDKLKAFQITPANAGEHWTEQYEDILLESDALREAEGGTTPAQWTQKAKEFDGVIIFDESHRMKKSRGRGASATGIRGTQLARFLPNARVMYMSATGTTEISNMAYMERLGIWGRNKPFAEAGDFITEMERGGIASQEVIARDLKAKGLFISRSLDFSDVVVRSLVHELPPEQIQTYNELANVWQEIRLYLFNYAKRLRDLADDTDDGAANTGKEIGDIWGEYYSKQQRFFQAMLDAMKMQSVIPDMLAQLDQGKKVTIQIVNPYEANQKRQEQRAQRAGIDMGEVELSAREILEDYLNEESGVLPIYDYEVVLDAETGENMLRVITNDTNETMTMSDGRQVPPGAPIPNMENVARREALLDLVFKSYLPASPLDQFVQAFKNRGLEIAESTGRSTRYYLDESGERVKEDLAPKRVRADVKKFNENQLMGLAFSKKGATGANYPATDPNHPIVQYVIQVGWQADDFKQGLGRSKRANEVAPPEIVTTATNMVGELRFQSTAASRAAELGATTRGQAQEGTGLDLFSFDAKYLNTDYGKNALYNLIYDLMTGSVIPVEGEVDREGRPLVIGWNPGEGVTAFEEVTGINVKVDNQTGRPSTERFPSVNRFMNRVLGAPSIALQNALYDAFFSRMSAALEEAKADGTLDTGIDTLDTESAEIREDYVLYTDPDTGAETYATLMEIEQKTDVISWRDVQAQIDAAQRIGKGVNFFLTDGGIYLDIETSTRTDDYGRVIQRLRRVSPEGRTRYLDANVAYQEGVGTRIEGEGISETDMADIQANWESEVGGVPETTKSNIMLVRGLMIDVWDKINAPIDEGDDFTSDSRRAEQIAARKLIRVITNDGKNIIGRRFTERADFQRMLHAFGKDPETISAVKQRVNARDVQIMLDDGFTIELANGFRVRRRMRAGQPYYAVEGNQSTLEGLVNDRVLEKFRPSGGAMTYVLPVGQANDFLDSFPPVASIKGNNRNELEYTPSDSPQPPPDNPDDDGGEGGTGGTPDTTPDSGSTPGGTPTRDTSTSVGMTDDQKIEMAIEKISGWVIDDIKEGKGGNEALDDRTKEGIWHGRELYELETFAGQSPEQVRDFFRNRIQKEINRQGFSGAVGRRFVALKTPEPLAVEQPAEPTEGVTKKTAAQREYDREHAKMIELAKEGISYKSPILDKPRPTAEEGSTDEQEPTEDVNELLKRIQTDPIQHESNQSGLLTFSIGSQVTAEIKKGKYDTQKSALVRFYVSDTAKPIELYYRGKAQTPQNIVDTLRKQLTPFEVRTALGQPTTIGDLTFTPMAFQIHTRQGMEDAYGLRVTGHKHDYAQLVVHRPYQRNKNGNVRWSQDTWQVSDMQSGLALPGGFGKTIEEAVKKATNQLDTISQSKYESLVQQAIKNRDKGETPTPAEETPSSQERLQQRAEQELGQSVNVDTKTDQFGTSIVISPNRRTTDDRSNPITDAETDREIQEAETQTDSDTPTPVQIPETLPSDSGNESAAEGAGDIPDGQYTYHGATFTETNGQLSITGDEIPESFWDYYHSGGRGRNSAHKRAMKDAGWEYTFRGKPRIYTFSISILNFRKWVAEHPDDGSAGTTLEEQGTAEQKALMAKLREAEVERVITDHGSPWRDDGHHYVFESIDDIRASVRRAWNRQRNAKAYEVTLYGTNTIEQVSQRVEWRDVSATDDNYLENEKKIEAIKFALTKLDPSQLVAKPKPEDIPQTPDAPREQIFEGTISALEAEEFTRDGSYHKIDIPELGGFNVNIMTRRVSTLMPGEPTTEKVSTEISFSSQSSPQTFKYFSLDVPESIKMKYDRQFEEEFLNQFTEHRNWERIGRRNAFKNITHGATLTIKKGRYQYEGNFENIPVQGSLLIRMDGENLWERFANALSTLNPDHFRYKETEKIIDTLKHELGQEETPNVLGVPLPAYYRDIANREVETLPAVPDSIDETERAQIGSLVWETVLQRLPDDTTYEIKQQYARRLEARIFDEIRAGADVATVTDQLYDFIDEITGEQSNVQAITEGNQQADSEAEQETPGTPQAESVETRVDNLQGSDTDSDSQEKEVELIDGTEDFRGEVQEKLETEPDIVAIVMAQQLIKPEDLSLSLEVGAALAELGLPEIKEWNALTADDKVTNLTAAYDRLIDASEDFSLTEKQTKAYQLLHEKAMAEARMSISGGAPLAQTFETIRAVPDLQEIEPRQSRRIPAGTQLQAKVDGWTPKMRLWLERSRRWYMSGYKNLDTLGAVGKALRKTMEYVLDIQDRGSIVDLRLLEPHNKALEQLARQRTPEGASSREIQSGLSNRIFRFMEDNLEIENDTELLKVAQGWKETWRKIQVRHVAHMLQLRSEVERLPGNERVVIRRSDGSTVKDWEPILPGHTWDAEQQMFKRESDKATLTAEQAILQSDRLYMPHSYPKSYWNAIVNQIKGKKIIAKLDNEAKKKGNKITGFLFNKNNNTYTFDRTGDIFMNKQDAIDFAKNYWTEQYALALQNLAGKENSVIGRYGHLELARETTDKLYMRDVTMLLDHAQMFWRRVGEIAAWGQYDPILGEWPRLAQYTARIGQSALTTREQALMAVADTLMDYDMFEELPTFKMGEKEATNVMQDWNTPDLQRMREDNPDAFTDEVLQTLVDIGFAERVGNTYELKGQNDAARRSTFIQHMVPHFEAMHLREEVVLKMVRGIGHWEPTDELNTNDAKFWAAINHITTSMTLGLGTSLQNLGEVPLLSTMAGAKNLTNGLQRLANDKEFRQMLPQLGAALSKARDYLADTDTQSTYLNLILFTPTEKWSRLTGTAVGWEAAKDAITNYLKNVSRQNRLRLEELQISVDTIDNYKSVLDTGAAPAFDDLVREAEERVLEGAMMVGGLRKPDVARPSNMHVDYVGDEMARAARYVSTRVFKGYNPLSLPHFLTKKDPMIRTFFKFKSWAAQMHQFMWEQFGHARREAMRGNFEPAWRLAQGMIGMGLSSSAILMLFGAMSGREEDDENRILQSLAMSHTLGIASMLMEIAIYADGNTYKAMNMLVSELGSPTSGVLARSVSAAVAGEPKEAITTPIRQLPGIREFDRFDRGWLDRYWGE